MVSGRAAVAAAAWKRLAAGVCVVVVAGCGGVQVRPAVTLPTPLVEKAPGSIGVFYPDEFRRRTHSEERRNIKFNVELGAASVATIDNVLRVMYDRIVPLEERGQITSVKPPVAMALMPSLDEYSFVTPQEMAGNEYAVTIRYRFELLDPKGLTVDQLTLTGFGTAPAGRLSTAEPLNAATRIALRDLAAKFIVDFPQQDSVVRLLRGEALEPLVNGQQEAATTLGVFEAPPPAGGDAAATDKAAPGSASPPAAPPTAQPPVAQARAESPDVAVQPPDPALPPAPPPVPGAAKP